VLRPPLVIVQYVWHLQNDPTGHSRLLLRVVTGFNVFFIIPLYRMLFYLQKIMQRLDTAAKLEEETE
jgi:hypothetical protein